MHRLHQAEEERDEIQKRVGTDRGRERERVGEEKRHGRCGRGGENSGRNLDVITPVYRVNSRLVIAICPCRVQLR